VLSVVTPADGIVVVDKPSGWTSHDVVAKVRRLAGTRKVGHAGTLDPMATGVLVLGIGRATRLLGYLSGHSKAYDATIRLGQSTLTDDADGELAQAVDASRLDLAAIESVMKQLTGELDQVPSAVSAVKIGGERAYKRVRQGKNVEIPPRRVTIYDFSMHAARPHDEVVDVDVHVDCTAGTYVRALARDLGDALGVGGHLTRLRRTRSGRYSITEARSLVELERELDIVDIGQSAHANFPTFTMTDDQTTAARNGRPLPIRLNEDPAMSGSHRDPVAVVSLMGEFIGLYEQHGPVAKAVAIFAPTPEKVSSGETRPNRS
jgi:tRNA pseudouridine55 synthase